MQLSRQDVTRATTVINNIMTGIHERNKFR